MDSSVSEEAAIRRLKELGYDVKRSKPSRRHTFEVQEDVFQAFRALHRQLGIRMKDATHLALTDWIKKNTKKDDP